MKYDEHHKIKRQYKNWLFCACKATDDAVYYTHTNEIRVNNMKNLIKKVADKFSGKIISDDTVKFSFGDDNYCLTDGTLYATLDDGSFLPGFKKVRGLLAVEHFVAERA